MSKFIDYIEMRLMGRKFAPAYFLPICTDPLTAEHAVKENGGFSILHEHRISIHWKMNYTCQPEASGHAMKNALRQLREDIYGEMRHHLLEIERGIINHDIATMQSGIDKAMKEAGFLE